MSSILLTNPFPAPPPPSSMQPGPQAVSDVAPIMAGSGAQGTDDSASYSGSGTGGGMSSQADTVALFQQNTQGKWAPPTDATGSSVINAQAQEAEPPIEYGANLPDVAMPDPLPTSPFLKGAADSGS